MVTADILSRRLLLTVALGAVVLSLLLAFTEPSSGLWPRCLFHSLTGLECPGCGSQRAFHALVHGHFSQAWSFNPLIFLLAPVIPLMLACALRPGRFPRLYRLLNSRMAALSLLFLLIIWTIIRNLSL